MCDVSKKALMVCDLDEPDCKQAVKEVKKGGFELQIMNVKDYKGLDYEKPQLYVGQLSFSGVEQIERFAAKFGPAYEK